MERRTLTGELRTELQGGKLYLNGRAASFGVMSHDLGFREVLEPGCFDAALARADLDVVANINHSMDRILGRTTAGTLQLTANSRGLNYKITLPSNVSYAQDLAVSCKRGDINSSSFAFVVDPDGETWKEIPDPDDPDARCWLRTITQIQSLHDVSVVGMAAYPSTAATIGDRSLPASMPAELRARLLGTDRPYIGNSRLMRATDDDACECDCPACEDGDCSSCSNAACDDENCTGVVQAAYEAMCDRCEAHGIAQADSEDDRAARRRKLQVAEMSW